MIFAAAIFAVFVIIVVCRLLARCIRDINTWDRRSGYYDDKD